MSDVAETIRARETQRRAHATIASDSHSEQIPFPAQHFPSCQVVLRPYAVVEECLDARTVQAGASQEAAICRPDPDKILSFFAQWGNVTFDFVPHKNLKGQNTKFNDSDRTESDVRLTTHTANETTARDKKYPEHVTRTSDHKDGKAESGSTATVPCLRASFARVNRICVNCFRVFASISSSHRKSQQMSAHLKPGSFRASDQHKPWVGSNSNSGIEGTGR